MLNALIRFSLRNRLFVVAAAAMLLAYGGFLITRLPVDVLPDLNRPTVTIFLEAHGLAPEEVESQVAFPVEAALNGATGVERVRSVSTLGLALVFVEFAWGTDIYIDRQIVTEKLATVRSSLPADVNPVLAPISSIMGEIMLMAVTSDSLSPMDLRDAADWTIRPRLLGISGVSQVTVIGGEVRQFQILAQPDRLKAYGVTLHELEEALRESNVNTSGGFIVDGPQESLVRNLGRIESLEEIGNITVTTRGGVPVLVSQLADLRFGGPIRRGDAGANGLPAVILSVQKQPGASTIELTKRLHAELDGIESTLPAGIRINREVFQQARFIEAAIHNVEEALRDGSLFVILVLFLFLLNLRTTFVTLTAIPLSIVITAVVFKMFGLSINTMTLGGLAVAIGELVDDAIVDVENIFRRLKENAALDAPRPILDVVYDASVEIRGSIVFATILVILVFLPLFALGGIEGRIFVPLGLAYILSIAGSLLVSLTVTPALSSYLLAGTKPGKHADGFLVRALKNFDRNVILRTTLAMPRLFMFLAVLVLGGAILLATRFGSEFLPPFNEGTVTINLLLPPGTSLEESNRVGRQAEKILLSIDGISNTGRRTGRAEEDEHAEGVHSSEIDVEIIGSEGDREKILGLVRQKLAGLPGVTVNIGQPISHRIDHLLSGTRAQIAIKLFGPDLATLREKAEEIRGVASEVPGVVDLFVEQQVLIPQTRVEIDREKLKPYGLRAGEVAEVLEASLAGVTVGEVLDGQRRYDMVLKYPDASRSETGAMENILIDAEDGSLIPLKAVARVRESRGPNQVLRENVARRIVVQCNVSGRDLGTVVEELRARVGEHVVLPEGYHVAWGGQFENQERASRMIAILSLFSLAGMFLVLYVHFKSWRLVLQVLLNIPFALIGSIAAIALTGGVVSIASLVAFVTLCGIASRNGIMMLSHYLHLMRHEGESFNRKMIIRGSLERLVPVLMTAGTAILALVPLILASGQAGKEILHPVAIVVFGGLISSTLLDIVLTPAVFYVFGRKAVRKVFRSECPEVLERVFDPAQED